MKGTGFLYRIYILVLTWLTFCKMWDVWRGKPGWGMCWCTDAVVTHGLGNVAGVVPQDFSSLANGRTEVEKHYRKRVQGKSPGCASCYSRKLWFSILCLPKTWQLCICVFVKSSDLSLGLTVAPLGNSTPWGIHSSLIWQETTSWECKRALSLGR